MLRYPVKLVLICAGLCGILLGAHGLYVHFSPSEIAERVLAGTFDPTRLFLGFSVPSWFKGTVQWATLEGADSWVIPALLILGGIVVGVVLYWVVNPLLVRERKAHTPPSPPISRLFPPPHPTMRCPRCGSNSVEGVYGGEHQRFRCENCGSIFQ